MRIIAGTWRGRALTAPRGGTTRPTADRLRQALFDMLMHAPWFGRDALDGAAVLDVFAGTGALGLEALSRGAAQATFIENDREALQALRLNIAACKAEALTTMIAADATRTLAMPMDGSPCNLLFLDPPYGRDLVPLAVSALHEAGWIAPNALIVSETERGETVVLPCEQIGERAHGAGRLTIWRMPN